MSMSLALAVISALALMGCGSQKDSKPGLSLKPHSQNGVIYGVSDLQTVHFDERVVALISHERTQVTRASGKVLFTGLTVSEEFGLCKTESMAQEVSLVHCSGFLLDRQTVLTAGHCVESFNSCKDFSLQQGKIRSQVNASELLKCKSVQKIPGQDLALIKLSQQVAEFKQQRPIKKVASEQAQKTIGKAVYSLGFPLGGGLKLSQGLVRSFDSQTRRLTTTIDSFDRSSGSPVFSQSDNQFLGILVSGESDFVNGREACLQHNRISQSQGTGEIVQLL